TDAAARGRGDMDLAAAADRAGGDANRISGFNAGIDVGHVSLQGLRSENGFPPSDFRVERRPSLRRYYPDQVQRVAGCSALNLFLHTGSPGMGRYRTLAARCPCGRS